jgi:metal-responsive CopG/Arc/MetJ family transcriptional regulator
MIDTQRSRPRPQLVKLNLPATLLDRIERAKRGAALSRSDAIRQVLLDGLKTIEVAK